jgi:hypothetical protein
MRLKALDIRANGFVWLVGREFGPLFAFGLGVILRGLEQRLAQRQRAIRG